MNPLKPQIVQFGESSHLIGIYQPAIDAGEQLPTIVTWNTGISHRVGPYGIFTELAKRYHLKGYPVLRFDLSALGDSDNRTDGSEGNVRTLNDIRDALDFLSREYGAENFILVGICSGAVDAFHAAAADSRVTGLCMVDTFAYKTKKFYYHYYRKRLFHLRKWKRFLQRVRQDFSAEEDDQFEGIYPSKSLVRQGLQELIKRQVRMHVIYTGGFDYLYSYKNQFYDMFPEIDFAQCLSLEHHERADHLFMLLETREKFFKSLDNWLSKLQEKLPVQSLKQTVKTPEETLLHLIEEWEQPNYKGVAIQEGSYKLSYHELASQSDHIASFLWQKGVKAGDRIAICMERCKELVPLIIGILKAGACYVPVDASYPPERIRYVLDDSRAQLLITDNKHYAALKSTCQSSELLLLDSLMQPSSQFEKVKQPIMTIDPDQPAYIMYTSGSTGEPKGVSMTHKALANLIRWQKASYPAGLKTLQFAPISFDVSFQEIFSTLLEGGTLVMIDELQRLDPKVLLNFIISEEIQRLFLPFIALQYLAEAANSNEIYPSCLKEVFTAGEQLKVTEDIRQFFSKLADSRLHNHYGPTETHVVTAYTLSGSPVDWPELPPIGTPLPNCELLLVQGDWQELPEGEGGELLVSGLCLAQGYWQKPEESQQRFVTHPISRQRFYRTGDLVRQNSAAQLEFIGRKDQQIKVRGYRIEAAEVEIAITRYTPVQQVVVDAVTLNSVEQSLIAFVICRDEFSEAAIRKILLEHLPRYMIPEIWLEVEEFPRTASGKINRKALVENYMAARVNGTTAMLHKRPQTKISAAFLCEIFRQLLQKPDFLPDDNFFDQGGHSLLAIKLSQLIAEKAGIEVSVLDIFEAPSPKKLAQLLAQKIEVQAEDHILVRDSIQSSEKQSFDNKGAIAIIGMAGRFPGADSIEELWQLLLEGKESARYFQEYELDRSISYELKSDPNYVPVRGILNRYAEFDCEFFKITPSEAALIDPQQRLLLELAWQALDDAGYPVPEISCKTGVFAGVGHNSYYNENIISQQEVRKKAGDFPAMIANDKDYAATRLAYKLNLKGPAITVQTACSTSLVAVVKAVQSLRAGDCEMALAGAASIHSPVHSGYLYEEGGILSRDGHCRPFDAEASGTYFSDGGAFLVLKKLDSAVRDGDRIYAVIRGIALNNDGADKASFSSPSVQGQVEVIKAALKNAGISDTSEISYVECHGTATPIGDPIEVEALQRIFQDKSSCAIGSIKSNFGHLTAAAGAAGLIKVALGCYHRCMPATINYRSPNPLLNLEHSAFRVLTKNLEWSQRQQPFTAGVSSFGIGGTNAHVIVSEYSHATKQDTKNAAVNTEAVIVCLSAHQPESLQNMQRQLDDWLKSKPVALNDVAYTCNLRRHHFPVRSFRIVKQQQNEKTESHWVNAQHIYRDELDLGFLFPGQGSQFIGMAQGLYEWSESFRLDLDRCTDWVYNKLKIPLKSLLLGDGDPLLLKQTLYCQPALFCYQYATARLMQSWGILPKLLVGHSIGEIAAAAISGVLSEESALELVCLRAKLMHELAPGLMIQVYAKKEELQTIVAKDLPIAAINAPNTLVLSGESNEIEEIKYLLDEASISYQSLETSHAFHSAMMEPMLDHFRKKIQGLNFRPAQIAIYSTLLGKVIDKHSVLTMDADYWVSQVRQTVYFASAIHKVWEDYKQKNLALLEIGPGQIASSLARRQITDETYQYSLSLTRASTTADEQKEQVLSALGMLWSRNYRVDWSKIPGHSGKLLSLPPYAFGGKRQWLEPSQSTSPSFQKAHVNSSWQDKDSFVKDPAAIRQGVDVMPATLQNLLMDKLKKLLSEVCGIEENKFQAHASLFELGLDSLFLTQIATTIKKEFAVPVTFRQISTELSVIGELAQYLLEQMPEELKNKLQSTAAPSSSILDSTNRLGEFHADLTNSTWDDGDEVKMLIQQQLNIMEQQLQVLRSRGVPSQASQLVPAPRPSQSQLSGSSRQNQTRPFRSGYGPQTQIHRHGYQLTAKNEKAIQKIVALAEQKTPQSKAKAQNYRSILADPRTVSGFRPAFKELVYPITFNKAEGAYLWDIDGHRYIDLQCGFGSNFFGYKAPFIIEQIHQGIEEGFAIGPQYHLVGECSELAAKVLGHDRVAWCNTGSEAVLAAMRIARAVSGKDAVVVFQGAYHGMFDEVLGRRHADGSTRPAVAGINPASLKNLITLEYGKPESLEVIRKEQGKLAAVLVEAVQSRNPDYVPLEYLQELRQLTEELGIILIIDEVITGLRCHPQGFQGWSGIKADLASYGKILGGGLPVGLVAGRRELMDTLDGGYWQFGDQSSPEAGVTYFAGTFVRHPLAIRAAYASLKFIEEQGPGLQEQLGQMTADFVAKANQIFLSKKVNLHFEHFTSLMYLAAREPSGDGHFPELLAYSLRNLGVHIAWSYPSFISCAHKQEDLDQVLAALEQSIDELLAGDLLKKSNDDHKSPAVLALSNEKLITPKKCFTADGWSEQPAANARLGIDDKGFPAWFIADESSPGSFLKWVKKH